MHEMRRSILILILIPIIIVVAVVAFISGWALTHPSSSDPKNIKYVLWKVDLYKLDSNLSTAAMVGDPNRDKIVVSKTKAQLIQKFGSLLSLGETSSYLRACYENSAWKGKDILFIGQSSWMIVFDGERATNLVLIKGC
jgi:hypothetical protein